MEPEILAAFIAGAFSLVAVGLAALANRSVRRLRDELQVAWLPARLDAYKKLWALFEPVAPTNPNDVTEEVRKELENKLRGWYYHDGNGIFLSANSQKLFLKARSRLRGELKPDDSKAIKGAFSDLRSELKNDIAVYGRIERRKQLG